MRTFILVCEVTTDLIFTPSLPKVDAIWPNSPGTRPTLVPLNCMTAISSVKDILLITVFVIESLKEIIVSGLSIDSKQLMLNM